MGIVRIYFLNRLSSAYLKEAKKSKKTILTQ